MIVLEESLAIRKMPLNLVQEDLPLFDKELQKKIRATKVLTLKKAKITGKSIVYTGFEIHPESFVEPSQIGKLRKKTKRIKYILKNNFLRKKIRINEPCIWFTDNWSHEYFHWITDALPRLLVVKEYLKSSILLLPEKYQSIDYIQRSLRTFAPKRVIYIPEKQVAIVKQLMLPTHTAPTGNYNEKLIADLRDHFQSYYQPRNTLDMGERIYISRSKALRRKVVNESEVIDLVSQYGFKPVVFEDYNFDEQVSIMANASYLISNHGAGLSNMLFLKKGSRVLELRRKGDNHNNCYFTLASALKSPYLYQTCPSENNEQDTFTANLIVDLNELKKNLELMLRKI